MCEDGSSCPTDFRPKVGREIAIPDFRNLGMGDENRETRQSGAEPFSIPERSGSETAGVGRELIVPVVVLDFDHFLTAETGFMWK